MDIEYPKGATPLDQIELDGLKIKSITTVAELNHLEQANIADGLLWLGRKKKPEIFAPAFITNLHARLFGQVWSWAGTYRTTVKNIGVDPTHINMRLYGLLDDVKYWTENDIYKPAETALMFHHRLVYIHPFPNGNGRFSRIMADTMMRTIYNSPSIDWLQGADLHTMGERRTQYIEALKAADAEDYSLLFKFAGI